MEFNIPGTLKINNSASLEEIANYLQNFTDLYLYIDDSVRLYSVEDVTDIPYEKCELVREYDGFLLKEKNTDRLIQVFLPEAMQYLIGIVEFTDFQGYYPIEDYISEEAEDYISEEAEECESEDSEDYISEDSEEINKEEFKNKLVELLTDKIDYKTDISSSEDYLVESIFRIFMRDIEDLECFNAIHINKDTFSEIELENDIDLKETIKISFTNFLKDKGYDVKVEVDFYDELFAEMKIYTNNKLDEKTVNEIDFSAKLNVSSKKFDNSTIFFILKCVNEEDDVYSTKVPLVRLPEDLQEICLRKAKYIKKDDIEQFYYQNSEMIIKNEGEGLYSLFDLDLYFYLSHLHPSLYYDTWNYNELPVAQFYLE